ncbi:hypothetical protein BYT27DRAFT_7175825 [Phlegmacium glaucopus]|nr:hypothetical protein BYT27DRAFT_7175825 [Phlegmacium glaucopus]
MHRPLLTDLPLDVQIHICELLHPSQILALRQTCKTVYEATLQRSVWIHALHHICRENSLFLPTFSIAAMSVAQLERAATAPLRWIALSSSKDRNNNEVLHPRGIRVIEDPFASTKNVQFQNARELRSFTSLYLVPGGRYLVTSSDCLGLWDLASVSDSDMTSDGKLTMWTTEIPEFGLWCIQPTPDGLGIRILANSSPTYNYVLTLYIFEIYPQKETPQFAKIAELMVDLPEEDPEFAKSSLNGNIVVNYNSGEGTVVVWDFVANTVASWFISNSSHIDEVIKVTETTLITTHAHSTPSLWIFQIPPLTPYSSRSRHDIKYPPGLAPVFILNVTSSVVQNPDSWYYDVPIYIDVENHETGNYERSKLDIACDLSNVSLVPIAPIAGQYPTEDQRGGDVMYYRICDEGIVNDHELSETIEVHTYPTSSGISMGSGPSSDSHRSRLPSLHIDMTQLAVANSAYSFCPASARLVYEDDEGVVISDFV